MKHMKHVKVFEGFTDDYPADNNPYDQGPVRYMVATDEPIGSNSFKPELKLYTLCADSESQALGFLAEALGNSPEGPFMDRWKQHEITTVLDMVKELNGMNGTWKLYEDEFKENAEMGMHEIKSIN